MPHSPFPVSFVAALAFACASCSAKKAAAPPAPPIRTVSVAKVRTHDVPRYLEEIGTCVAQESVAVQAQISGQIMARNFADGADVKKGDLLFTIDPRPYQAALDQAEGALGQNRAQLQLDNINLNRVTDLSAKKVVSPQDLDTAKTNLATTQAKIKAAEGAVEAARVNLDFCSIRSPIDGRAGLRQVDVGNLVAVSSGSATLVTIQSLDPIYTDFTVAESDLSQLRKYLPGGKIKVETDLPDDSAPSRLGDLYFVDTAVQSSTGTVKLRGVTPNNDHALWPGAFARVRVILETIKDARLAPAPAVQISQRGPFVFVVKPDNTLEQRPVTLGQRQGDWQVIEKGLNPDETVVTSGQLALAPGVKVNPLPETAPAPVRP